MTGVKRGQLGHRSREHSTYEDTDREERWAYEHGDRDGMMLAQARHSWSHQKMEETKLFLMVADEARL